MCPRCAGGTSTVTREVYNLLQDHRRSWSASEVQSTWTCHRVPHCTNLQGYIAWVRCYQGSHCFWTDVSLKFCLVPAFHPCKFLQEEEQSPSIAALQRLLIVHGSDWMPDLLICSLPLSDVCFVCSLSSFMDDLRSFPILKAIWQMYYKKVEQSFGMSNDVWHSYFAFTYLLMCHCGCLQCFSPQLLHDHTNTLFHNRDPLPGKLWYNPETF